MPFGKAEIVEISGDTAELKKVGQATIDLVYTSFGNDKVLKELNKKRIQNIFKAFPQIKKNNVSDINYFRQLDNGDKEYAKQMFHGILIRFRLKQDEATVKRDLKKLDELVYSDEAKKMYAKKDSIRTKRVENTISLSDLKKASGFRFSESGMELEFDSLAALRNFNSITIDSTIYKTFKRNKWRNYAIACDVTGSMYPYTAQLLIWLRLESLRQLTNKYTFFNDGDNKRDNEKIIGNTGGVFSKECNSYEEVEELLKMTMRKGGGGDAPENNIEAIIKTESNFRNIDFTVLIADNWAPIKDLSFYKQINKPVRIIICGYTNGYVNIDYLNLAKATNGSIHTIERDIQNLVSLNEGQMLTIGKRTYKIINGQFVELKTL